MISDEARYLIATDADVRAALRAKIDAAQRKKLKKQGKPRVRRTGTPCTAVLGPFSSRPGEKCGRVTLPGNIFCGIHGGER